jgi:N-acetylglucosamine kinase-like BadF-type ATPase
VQVLGIDAGGTKTVCYLADGDGRVIGESRGGGANLQTEGELGVEKVLHALMREALGRHDPTVSAICLGMAGVDRAGEGAIVCEIMRRIGAGARVVVVNDALVALAAGVGDAPGVVLISGTGSIAYGRDRHDRAARAGGWGHVLGDEGSGYWIGRQALRAVARAADSRGPATDLVARVLRHFEVERPSDLVAKVYQSEPHRPELARLARVVQEARDEGDELATHILEQAAHELVRAARSVVERLQLREEAFEFILSGGVFAGVPWLTEELERRLPAIAPGGRVRRLEVEPALGAVRLALAEAAGGARVPTYIR